MSLAVLGSQWGDEGKGKVVDFFAKDFKYVVRFQGGNNAGHTLVMNGEKFIVHVLPSGILRPDVTSVIGPGVVVNPDILLGELRELKNKKVEIGDLRISDRSHVILPVHVALDKAREGALGRTKLGTCLRGIGPAYEDRAGRRGIRMHHLLYEDNLKERIEAVLDERNFLLQYRYGMEPVSVSEVLDKALEWGRELEPYICDTKRLIECNGDVLFEGAQGAMLDIDHGTYPFVTSSTTTLGGVCSGAGVAGVDMVCGVVRAYVTRVGTGPFPTEILTSEAARLRKVGEEFGATTGRPRRIGWLDIPMLRYSLDLNGCSDIFLTKLDVLSCLDEVKIAINYNGPLVGNLGLSYPAAPEELKDIAVEYRTFPGWGDISNCRKWSDLPKSAQDFVKCVEDETDTAVYNVGVGPSREQVVEL